MLRKARRLIRNVVFDLRFGGFIGGSKKTPFAHLGAKDTINSDYGALPWVLGPVLEHGDVFVDVGCGRGRVLNWVLAQHKAAKLYGIEIDPEVAREVRTRLARYPNVEILVGDALQNIPGDATLFYLYNPFARHVMEQYRDALIESYGRSGGLERVRLVYYNCVDVDVYERDPRCVVRRLDLPPEFHPSAVVTFTNPR